MGKNETSPLWGHFSKVNGDFRNAKCNHCEQIVRRCREDQSRGKAVNRMMQMHMKKMHPDVMIVVAAQQKSMKVKKNADPRDESSR